MGHGGRALLTFREKLFGFKDFGALHVADFGGDVLDRAGNNPKGGKEGGVAVARDDLGADRFRLKPQFVADMRLNRGVNVGEGADSARDCTGRDFCARGLKAAAIAVHFRIKARECQAHGDGFGVDAMAATDADRVLVFQCTALEGGQKPVHIRKKDISGAHKLDVERGVQDIRRGHALMDKAGLFIADDFGQVGQEGDDVVLGDMIRFVARDGSTSEGQMLSE